MVINLESLVKSEKAKKAVSLLGDTVSYVLPFLEKYDPEKQAEILLADFEVANIGITKNEAATYLSDSYQKHKRLFAYAKLADTADRLTSLAGLFVETAGLYLGIVPGFMANLNEELVEMIFKVPFITSITINPAARHKFLPVLAKEAATFGLPVAGDLYDASTNLYMRTANDIIMNNAKQNILSERRSAAEFNY